MKARKTSKIQHPIDHEKIEPIQPHVAEPVPPAAPAPWSGEVDETFAVRPGGLLIAALVQCAAERGQSFPEMCRELGYSYPYLNLLMSGVRQVNQISDDFARACAAYLRVPRMTVLMMAGRITQADLMEPGLYTPQTIEPAFQVLSKDAAWGALVTEELRDVSMVSKYALVKMYEKAEGKKLLPEMDIAALQAEVTAMQAHIGAIRAELAAKKEKKLSLGH
ncbi:MAG: DNA-binding protein [Burkholderiales bacterium]|nr:DNA-binding protein [Burkholderiales bacterium]